MLRVSRGRRKKEKMFQEFKEFLQKYRYVILVDAYRLKANMLNEVRGLQDQMNFVIKGGKINIFIKALESINPVAASEIVEVLFGQRLFIFTNEDPIRISYELDKFEVDIEASPGDVAPIDIIIPSGNTGIPPGPVISLFSNLSIPTKIVGGAINVVKDTLVARVGDRISPNLANLLIKLGIKPIKSKVNLIAAYDLRENILIKREYLVPDLEKLEEEISKAFSNAYKLGLEIGLPTSYTIVPLIVKAYLLSKRVAVESEYVTPETINDIIRYAYLKAMAIKRKVEPLSS